MTPDIPTAELDLAVADLARRARTGDRLVVDALGEASTSIGFAATILINLFGPHTVLIGGHYATLAPWMLPIIERIARSFAATPAHARARLGAATLGHDAAAHALTAVFSKEPA